MTEPIKRCGSFSTRDALVLKPGGEDYTIDKYTHALELSIEWTSLRGSFCDLDVFLYIYDESARFVEKLNFDKPISKDGAFHLLADLDNTKESKTHEEQVHIDIHKISSSTSSAIVFIDGGPRNFQYASTINVTATKKNINDAGASSFSLSLDNISQDDDAVLFRSSCAPRKDYQAMLALVMHKNGFLDNECVAWSFKALFDPVMLSRTREKDEYCDKTIVNVVPSLHQYRPHLFPSVQSICAELSSTALPNLKRLFTKDSDGLPINQFSEVLFMQLLEVNNGLFNLSEAAYTIAMLHELFGQIDYNGDGYVDWDEFTTFCIYTGLNTESTRGNNNEGEMGSLDEYVIEYAEDKNLRDTVTTSYAPLALMRHVPTTKRLFVLTEQSDALLLMTERLGLYAKINPKKYVEDEDLKKQAAALKIMDVVYIGFKDLICYSASDHSIVFCKELQGHSKKVTFNIYNRIYHAHLHVKLCWGDAGKILCSVNVENTIFGWEIDSTAPLFQITRHSQKITDFLALDSYGLFATCSLDKRIKLWSQTTRRMKGVLVGHKRGVRFLSQSRDCLLSAGFECDAKTWDLDLYEQALTLRGHRASITACKVMSRPDHEEELRGLTVDETGEIRLWDLYVKKGSDSTYATTLQTFCCRSSEDILSKVNFLAVPYDAEFSNGQYSNIIAGTCSLIHFRPEKSAVEFIPPTCMIYSDTNCCLLTGSGKNLLKYDVITGAYQTCFRNIGNSEITCMCMDGAQGRRVFVGFSSGYVYVINFASGQIISSVHAQSKAVSCICLMKTANREEDVLYCGSTDGTIRMISEGGGELVVHNTLEHSTNDHAAIGTIVPIEEASVIVAASIARCWGIWHRQTFKRYLLLQEADPVTSVVVIGGGCSQSGPIVDYDAALAAIKAQAISVAIALSTSIRVYSVDLQNVKAIKASLTHVLQAPGVYISKLISMKYPEKESLNYKLTVDKTVLEDVLVASTDSGKLIVWDTKRVRDESLKKLFEMHPDIIDKLRCDFPDSAPPISESFEKKELETIPEDVNFIAHHRDLCSMDSFDSFDGYDSDHSADSLFSLTSTMGTIQEGVRADENDPSSMNMMSLRVAKTTKLGSSASRKSKGLEEFRALRRATTIDVEDTNNSSVEGIDDVDRLQPVIMWHGHKDSIVDMTICGDSGCFATLSLDGFHGIWNLQKDCLGILPLPNLSDEMKKLYEDASVEWNFMKEKIPVKRVHVNLATRLLENVEKEKNASKKINKDVTAGARNRPTVLVKRKKKVEIATTDDDRTGILMSLLGRQKDVPVAKTDVVSRLPGSAIKRPKHADVSSMTTSSSAASLGQRSGGDSSSKEASLSSMRSSSQPSLPFLSPIKTSPSSQSIFKSKNEWNNSNDFVKNPVSAFSESSLQDGYKDGLLDDESHRILKALNKDESKIEAFDRLVPGVMLRNVSMATTMKFPEGEISHSEIKFGQQKNMYKNANQIISEKNKISTSASTSNARYGVALMRLKQNMASVGPMIKPTKSLYSEEIALPSIPSPQPSSGDKKGSHVSLDPLKSGKPDMDKVSRAMKKVAEAEDEVPSWEQDVVRRKEKNQARLTAKQMHASRPQQSQQTVLSLERKLACSIRCFHVDKDTANPKSKVLSTRALLPHYKLSDVTDFLNVFFRVDVDFSGNLDIDEWIEFFTAFNKSMSTQSARQLFSHIDTNRDGLLSLHELVPVIFPEATPNQQGMIARYIEDEVSRYMSNFNKQRIYKEDLSILFDAYDADNIGYIKVQLLRTKLSKFQLPIAAQLAFNEKLKKMEDDDMLNLPEFTRMFISYLAIDENK